MHRPPKLWSAHLDDLVDSVGGDASACRLLDVTDRTLRRWRAGENVPRMALDLLWYAGAQGAAAAQAEYSYIDGMARLTSDARQREVERLQGLLAASAANGAPVVLADSVVAVNDPYGAIPPSPPQRRSVSRG